MFNYYFVFIFITFIEMLYLNLFYLEEQYLHFFTYKILIFKVVNVSSYHSFHIIN